MKQLIACCGLDCENCTARIATVNNDDELREKRVECAEQYAGNYGRNHPLYGVPCRWGEVCLLQQLLCYP